MSDEIDEKWWSLFKGNEEKRTGVTDSPTAKADQLLTRFETDLKGFERAKNNLTESISRIIPALEEEKKLLREEIDLKSKRVVEIEDQIKVVKKWMKKHREILESAQLKI